MLVINANKQPKDKDAQSWVLRNPGSRQPPRSPSTSSGISQLAIQAQKTGLKDEQTEVFTAEALATLPTNRTPAIVNYLKKTEQFQNLLQQKSGVQLH